MSKALTVKKLLKIKKILEQAPDGPFLAWMTKIQYVEMLKEEGISESEAIKRWEALAQEAPIIEVEVK